MEHLLAAEAGGIVKADVGKPDPRQTAATDRKLTDGKDSPLLKHSLNPQLRIASLVGAQAAVRLHIARGDDLNARDGGGRTPLMLAALKNRAKICEMLLAGGADLLLVDTAGLSAHDLAIASNALDAVRVLDASLMRLRPVAIPTQQPIASMRGNDDPPFTLEALDESGDWEIEGDHNPVESDGRISEAEAVRQRSIGKHQPTDNDDDWADIDVVLPAHAVEVVHGRQQERLDAVRNLILTTLRDATISEHLIAEAFDSGDAFADGEERRRMELVLGDLGGIIDEYWEPVRKEPDEVSDDEEDIVSEARRFLALMESGSDDPVRYYGRDLSRSKLLTSVEEVALGQEMEATRALAIEALSLWPTGVNLLICHGETLISSSGIIPVQWMDIGPESASDEGRPIANETGSSAPSDDSDEENDPERPARSGLAAHLAEIRLHLSRTDGSISSARALGNALSDAGLTIRFLKYILASAEQSHVTVPRSYANELNRYLSARNRLVLGNIRLVSSIVRAYQRRGMSTADLIQEANIGLMRAAERYDWRRGFRFSTYATWWIRQAASRALADQSRTVRMPVHLVDKLTAVRRIIADLELESGRRPTSEQVSEKLGFNIRSVKGMLAGLDEPPSLDDRDSTSYGAADRMQATDSSDPFILAVERSRCLAVEQVLNVLKPQQAEIIRLRFGIDKPQPLTLEEVGTIFGVTRERIRQIEAKALLKLRHPVHRKILGDFVDWQVPLDDSEPDDGA